MTCDTNRIFFVAKTHHQTHLYLAHRHELSAGDEVTGPAVIEQLDATTLVYPGDAARVDNFGNLLISLGV